MMGVKAIDLWCAREFQEVAAQMFETLAIGPERYATIRLGIDPVPGAFLSCECVQVALTLSDDCARSVI